MTRQREGWAAPDPWSGLRRVQRAQKRLADGSLGGATNLASPVSAAPVGAPLAAARPSAGGETNFSIWEGVPVGGAVPANSERAINVWTQLRGDANFFQDIPGYGASPILMRDPGTYQCSGYCYVEANGAAGTRELLVNGSRFNEVPEIPPPFTSVTADATRGTSFGAGPTVFTYVSGDPELSRVEANVGNYVGGAAATFVVYVVIVKLS